jgi:transcriptional regulator with XRE-family HTH domain
MPPYVKFGQVLHTLRRSYHVSKKELCGALEINEDYLHKLESGVEKPSEDLIEQMISHFALDDNLADNLWRLAGFTNDKLEDVIAHTAVLPLSELKVAYTDMVHVSVNNFGVVLNFMQNVGPNNQPVVVSRLGMSKEHAQSVVDVLARTLKASGEQHHKSPLELPDGDA